MSSGETGNSPFRIFSANSEALSISGEKQNLLGFMVGGENVWLKE